MDNSVVIKGKGNSIIVVLDDSLDFETIKKMVAEKFASSAKFLGNCKMALEFEGRELSDAQELELLDVINQNSDLDVACILDNSEGHNVEFENAVKEEKAPEPETAAVESLIEYSGNLAQFYKGNLRSGQMIEMDTSVIVIGDVNPGATVSSNGNILILGSLKGIAIAGASGNRNAFVFALDMNPMQIRIADMIARSPDNPEKNQVKESKIAYLEDDNIYIESVTKSVLNDIRLN